MHGPWKLTLEGFGPHYSTASDDRDDIDKLLESIKTFLSNHHHQVVTHALVVGDPLPDAPQDGVTAQPGPGVTTESGDGNQPPGGPK